MEQLGGKKKKKVKRIKNASNIPTNVLKQILRSISSLKQKKKATTRQKKAPRIRRPRIKDVKIPGNVHSRGIYPSYSYSSEATSGENTGYSKKMTPTDIQSVINEQRRLWEKDMREEIRKILPPPQDKKPPRPSRPPRPNADAVTQALRQQQASQRRFMFSGSESDSESNQPPSRSRAETRLANKQREELLLKQKLQERLKQSREQQRTRAERHKRRSESDDGRSHANDPEADSFINAFFPVPSSSQAPKRPPKKPSKIIYPDEKKEKEFKENLQDLDPITEVEQRVDQQLKPPTITADKQDRIRQLLLDIQNLQQTLISFGREESFADMKATYAEQLGQKQQELTRLQKGSGKNKDGLTDRQIKRVMKPYPEFIGVVARDEISHLKPKLSKHRPSAFIFNTDPSTKEGNHWIAVYIDLKHSKSVEYFDSFGTPPDMDVITDITNLVKSLKPKHMLKFKYNLVTHQNNSSSNCGYFAMNFIIQRLKGQLFSEVTGYDTLTKNKSKKYEKQIERLKKQKPFKYI